MIWLFDALKLVGLLVALYIVTFWVHFVLHRLPRRRVAAIKAERRRLIATIPELEVAMKQPIVPEKKVVVPTLVVVKGLYRYPQNHYNANNSYNSQNMPKH